MEHGEGLEEQKSREVHAFVTGVLEYQVPMVVMPKSFFQFSMCSLYISCVTYLAFRKQCNILGGRKKG